MDELFWVGQVVWACILACGAYVSFCYFDLADAERARTVKPEKQAAQSRFEKPGFDVAHRTGGLISE
jgi:hypothetical protein